MRNLIALLVVTLLSTGFAQTAPQDLTITLIPGLTTDAFYITMNRGAQAAAEALGITVNFQGAEEFNPALQVPVLNSVVARKPDAILIAPTDSTQLIAPLARCGQPRDSGRHRRHFYRQRSVPNRQRQRRLSAFVHRFRQYRRRPYRRACNG